MCRSIKPLRNMDHPVTEQEIQEAALQYIRKVSGYRKPSKANEEAFNQEAALQYIRKVSGYRKPSKANEDAFNQAILEVTETTRKMLENLHLKAGTS